MKTHKTHPGLLWIAGLSVLLVLMLALLVPGPLHAQNSRSTLKNFQHVFIIMMENTGFATLIGNSNAPSSILPRPLTDSRRTTLV